MTNPWLKSQRISGHAQTCCGCDAGDILEVGIHVNQRQLCQELKLTEAKFNVLLY